MNFKSPQEVIDWADAVVAEQMKYPDQDSNPYSTPCNRRDWQRGFNGDPCYTWEGGVEYDPCYQRGAAYKRYLDKIQGQVKEIV